MPTPVEEFYSVAREIIPSRHSRARSEVIKVNMNGDSPGYIVPIGDIHLGHRQSNIQLLEKTAQFILNTPNCYTVLLGDLSETATKISVGKGLYEEEEHIYDQMKRLESILTPLAEKSKIIGSVIGNHEYRTEQMIGMNSVQLLSEKLEIPYCEFQGFALITIGTQKYTMVWHHGHGGGATDGGKVNSAMKQTRVVEADLFISGHTHYRGTMETPILYIEDGELKQRTRHVVSIGSFLEYFGNYPQMQLLPIANIGPVLIELSNERKEIHTYR